MKPGSDFSENPDLEEQTNRWVRTAIDVHDQLREANYELSQLRTHNESLRTLLAKETEWRNSASAECGRVKDILFRLRTIVDRQAEDEGLWFVATTAAEAYLQQELRQLHAAVEAE